MVTAVRTATQPATGPAAPVSAPAWDWLAAPMRGDTDAATARAALARRIAWRLANPEAWRAQLADLSYFDPAYTYDEGHEYELDWTTDPHLGADIHHKVLDEDGFVSPEHLRHGNLITALLRVFRSLLGNRVEREPDLHFDPDFGGRAGMYTAKGHRISLVKPDLVVLPRAWELPAGRERSDDGRTMRLDEGHPIPELVLEVLSPTTRNKDLTAKRALYALLGIREYATLDPGGQPEPNAPAELRLYRLQADGDYAEISGEPNGDGADRFLYSETCGTFLGLWQPDLGQEPRLQWFDADRNRWRDPASDIEYDLRESRAALAAERIAMLRTLLDGVVPRPDLDRIADVWQRDGAPDDAVDRIAAVRKSPRDWHALLSVRPTDGERDAPPLRETPSRRDW